MNVNRSRVEIYVCTSDLSTSAFLRPLTADPSGLFFAPFGFSALSFNSIPSGLPTIVTLERHVAALGRIFADRLLRSGVLTEEEAAQLPVDARPRPVDHRVDHPAPGAVVLRWTWWFQKGEPVSEDYSIQFYIQIISIYIYI